MVALVLAAGAVVIICNGNLFILLSLQLALVEAQGTFQNVFDLFSKGKENNKKINEFVAKCS